MKSVIAEVKKLIKPSSSEEKEMKTILDAVVKATKKTVKDYGLDFTVSGSFIRNTWLPDKKEFDIFILFPVKYSRGELESLGLDIGKKIMKTLGGKAEIAYAEHPYTRGVYKKYSIDIVPCYKVKSASEIKSAVDRTPFHNEYMKKHITRKLADEVRLLKRFTKSIGVYGSDVKTMGFSGYLCEILILHYKTFSRFVKDASSWEPQVFIDIEGHCIVKDARSVFKDQPLVAIDPTDPKRNVAAALSPENFAGFVKHCRDFLARPAIDAFFYDKKVPSSGKLKNLMEKRSTHFLGIHMPRPDVVDDVIWSQLRRTARRIEKILAENDFLAIGKMEFADDDDIIIVFEMEIWNLPPVKKMKGPPVFNVKNSNRFKNKYGKRGRVFVESDRWVAEIEREYVTPEIVLGDIFSHNTTELLEMGIASKLAENAAKTKIIKKEDIYRFIEEKKEFRKNLHYYLTKDFS